jgi:hypothetical protein
LYSAGARPVDLDRDALREDSRFDQVKRHVRAVVGEQPSSLANDHRDDEQIHLVDEVVLEQPPGQGAAAVHLKLTRRLGFQLADGRREVTGEHGRVRPPRVGEGGRCHVLGPGVQGICDGAAARIHHAPVAGEKIASPPAEQERAGALVQLVDERHGLAVEQRPGPSASLESAAAVLIPRAVSLHHSIDGDLRGGRQFHDRGSLLLGGGPCRRPDTPATNTSAPIRYRLPDFFRELSGTPIVSDPTASDDRPFRYRSGAHPSSSAIALWSTSRNAAPVTGAAFLHTASAEH